MEYVKVTREMGVEVVGRTSGGDDRRVKTSRIIRRALLFLNRLPIFVRCWFTLSSIARWSQKCLYFVILNYSLRFRLKGDNQDF